jgi:hypothetical protein
MLALGVNPHPSFFTYGLQKIRRGLRPTTQPLPQNWYNEVVKNFAKYGRSPKRLEFLLKQPEWNPGTIRNLLNIMLWSSVRDKNLITIRLGTEFLNPRLTFRGANGIESIGGIDVLNVAIHQAEADTNYVNAAIHQADPNYYILNLDGALRSIRDQIRI